MLVNLNPPFRSASTGLGTWERQFELKPPMTAKRLQLCNHGAELVAQKEANLAFKGQNIIS
jgi:hypothetical protein